MVAKLSGEVAIGIAIKFVGAVAGAILALVFVPPRSVRGFIRRATAALIAGPIFGPYVQGWAGFADAWEGVAGAACLTAFASWWLMGAVKRAVETWRAGQEE